MQEDIEPLEPDLWFRRIEFIANGQLASTENGLRHAFHLLQLSPRGFRPPDYGSLDEESYEMLLETGDLEEAARLLVSAPALTVTTCSSAKDVQAAVRCRALMKTTFGSGDSVAAAILQAWARCLLHLPGEFGSEGFNGALRS